MKKHTFHLGLLGLGSRSTQFYIEQINRKYHLIHGGYSTCPFLLLNTDFNEINPFLPNKYKKLKENLIPYFKELKKLEISNLLIPNITLHETLDIFNDELNFPFSLVHPIKNTLNLLKKKKIKEIVLIGSLYSMQGSYITNQFKNNGIKVTLPLENEMEFIDDFRQQIYNYEECSNNIIRFKQLIKRYSSKNSILIACTELSLVLNKITANTYDMARIQIEEALKN